MLFIFRYKSISGSPHFADVSNLDEWLVVTLTSVTIGHVIWCCCERMCTALVEKKFHPGRLTTSHRLALMYLRLISESVVSHITGTSSSRFITLKHENKAWISWKKKEKTKKKSHLGTQRHLRRHIVTVVPAWLGVDCIFILLILLILLFINFFPCLAGAIDVIITTEKKWKQSPVLHNYSFLFRLQRAHVTTFLIWDFALGGFSGSPPSESQLFLWTARDCARLHLWTWIFMWTPALGFA